MTLHALERIRCNKEVSSLLLFLKLNNNSSSLNKEIMKVTVIGYLNVIILELLWFSFFVFSVGLISIEKLQTRKTVFDYISKHLEVRQKYSATQLFFNFLLGVWKCGETQPFVFDILHRWPTCLTYGIGLVAYLLTIMSINSCMVPLISSQAVLLSCSTAQGSRATSDNLPAPAQDRASPTVNCSSTWRICRPKHHKTKITPWMLSGWFTCKETQLKDVGRTPINKNWKNP